MYIGKTLQIPQTGGWNNNPNLDAVPANCMQEVSNLNLHRGGLQPRGGCDNFQDISESSAVMGIYQITNLDGTIDGNYVIDENDDNIGDENDNLLISEGAIVVVGTANGKILKDYDTTLKTGLTNDLYFKFEKFFNTLYITNGVDHPQEYTIGKDYTWDMGTPYACNAAIGAAAGNVDNGTHSYKITYVTESGESTGSPKSDVITITDKASIGKVNLTNIAIGAEGTTSRKIYRTVAGDTGNYKLLATLLDNTTTSYEDNIADVFLGVDAPTTNLAFMPTDWLTDSPSDFYLYGRKTQSRMVAFGCDAYPYRIYLSANGLADFSDDNVVAINIPLDRITGVVEYNGILLIFGSNKTYYLDTNSIAIINWGYTAATWDGGAAHQKLIVKTPSDIAVMDETGNIYSINSVQQTGDNKTASLTKPFHIDKWIRDNIDLLQIKKFHAIYDPNLRAIKWFMVKNGYDYPTVCLVYYIDYAIWSKHDFADYHIVSSLIKETLSKFEIYTGGDDSEIYRTESSVLQDNGVDYTKYFTTPLIPVDTVRSTKLFDKIWLVLKPDGAESFTCAKYIDGRSIGSSTLTVDRSDTFMQNMLAYIGCTGLRAQATFTHTDDNDFYISSVLLDFQQLGSSDEFNFVGGI